MNSYELAILITSDPVAYQAEMQRRKSDLNRRIAAAAKKVEGLSDAQERAYLKAIEQTPACGPKGEAIPIHEIGMEAALLTGK